MMVRKYNKFRICKNKYGYFKVQKFYEVERLLFGTMCDIEKKWEDISTINHVNGFISIDSSGRYKKIFTTKDFNEIKEYLDKIITFINMKENEEWTTSQRKDDSWECDGEVYE